MLKIQSQNWFTKDKEWSSKWGQFHISWSSYNVESLCSADKPSKAVWYPLMKINSNLPNIDKRIIHWPKNRCQINLKSSSNSFASKLGLRFETIIQYVSSESIFKRFGWEKLRSGQKYSFSGKWQVSMVNTAKIWVYLPPKSFAFGG